MSKAVTDVRVRLLRRGAPRPDENLLGYIVRLTEENGYETPAWITMLGKAGYRGSKWKEIGETGLSNCSLMFYDEAAYYDGLAQVTGATSEAIQRAAYPAAPPAKRGSVRYWMFNEPVSRTLIGTKPKICPDCLAEQNYCRKIWDLTIMTVCPLHRCSLISSCPQCQQPLRWHRNEVARCHHCGVDWRSCLEQRRVPEQELEYVRQIYRRCGLTVNTLPAASTNPLYSLNLEDYIRVLFFIASQFDGLNETIGKCLRKNSVEKLHSLMARAFIVFEEFPHNYHEFLEWRRSVPTELPNSKKNCETGLHKDFGNFWITIYTVFKSQQFGFLRDAFEQYLRERWDGGYISTNSRLNESTRFSKDRKYLTRGQAMRLLKTHLGWVDRFADEGRIKVKVKRTEHKRLMLYNAVDVRRLRAEFDQSLGLQPTAKRLGVGVKQLKELVEYGYITALRGRAVDGYKPWRFSIAVVDDFLEKLATFVRQNPDRKARRIDLHRAVKCAGRTSIKMVCFIHSVLNGELRPCGWDKRNGVYGLLFLEPDVLAYIQHGYWKDNAQQMTINGAAKKLNMRRDVLKFLVEKGFIKVEANITNRMAKLGARAIGASELERFVATYIPTVHLAYELKSTSQRVLKVLKTKNIFPITGKAVDGGNLYLVRRSDLAAVDLKQLLKQA
jgi:hypothetical protein